MHKPTTWRKSRICRTKENSQRFYHYTHAFSIPYNAHNFGMEGSISRISLKIVTQCCTYLNNDKMRQVVGLCKYSHHLIVLFRVFSADSFLTSQELFHFLNCVSAHGTSLALLQNRALSASQLHTHETLPCP